MEMGYPSVWTECKGLAEMEDFHDIAAKSVTIVSSVHTALWIIIPKKTQWENVEFHMCVNSGGYTPIENCYLLLKNTVKYFMWPTSSIICHLFVGPHLYVCQLFTSFCFINFQDRVAIVCCNTLYPRYDWTHIASQMSARNSGLCPFPSYEVLRYVWKFWYFLCKWTLWSMLSMLYFSQKSHNTLVPAPMAERSNAYSRVHSLWLLVDHCVLRNWDRILVRAVKGLISRAGMVSICPLLWQRDVKPQQTTTT